MAELNAIIHQPVRLRIMAALCQLPARHRIDFSTLKKTLDLTDGNLGAHLQTLEQAGYVEIEKVFQDRVPKTYVSPSEEGRKAFQAHVKALRSILS